VNCVLCLDALDEMAAGLPLKISSAKRSSPELREIPACAGCSPHARHISASTTEATWWARTSLRISSPFGDAEIDAYIEKNHIDRGLLNIVTERIRNYARLQDPYTSFPAVRRLADSLRRAPMQQGKRIGRFPRLYEEFLSRSVSTKRHRAAR